jgi:hypothetical protein
MQLFGYSISLNVLILIGVLYLIMVVNALSSSCNREGMAPMQTQQMNKVSLQTIASIKSQIQTAISQNAPNKLTATQKANFTKLLSPYSPPAASSVERAHFNATTLLKRS